MSLLKQVISELSDKHYGVAALPYIDKNKNKPSKVALPFTTFMVQHSSVEGEEEGGEHDGSDDADDIKQRMQDDFTDDQDDLNVPPRPDQTSQPEDILNQVESQPDEAYQVMFNAIRNGDLDLDGFQTVLKQYCERYGQH